MKKRLIHIYILTIRLCAPAFTLSALSALGAMLVLLAGCIHQYPDDGQAADVTLRCSCCPNANSSSCLPSLRAVPPSFPKAACPASQWKPVRRTGAVRKWCGR